MPSNLAINNDGTKLVVCRGHKIVLYDCGNGSIIKELKGHKDKVYTVSFSCDGKRIASGGADKSTIIWSEEGKGILKFTHVDSIQVVAYNPVRDLLASCSSSDFGFWSQQKKSVVKYKTESKILCASWRHDGLVLAIGLFSGNVSFYNLQGIQIGSICRNAPVWSLSWSSSLNDCYENSLAMGSWDMTLSFYNEFGGQLHDDISLDFFPSSVAFLGRSSEYIVVGGSSGNLKVMNRKGVFLDDISSSKDAWIWSNDVLSKHQTFVAIDSSGILSLYRYNECEIIYDKWINKVAIRENCSDVIVHDMNQQQSRKIRCNELVKAIALIEDQVALVIKNEVQFYEYSSSTSLDTYDFKCRVVVLEPISCILMMTNLVIISMGRSLKAFQNNGELINDWDVDSDVSSVQRHCHALHEEKFLVGCENGKIYTLTIDSPFQAIMLNLEGSVTSIEVSCKGRYLGIICDKCNLCIFDQITKSQVLNIKGPESILFHNQIESLFCYENNENVTIQDLNGHSIVHASGGQVINFVNSNIVRVHNDWSLQHNMVNLVPLAYHKAIKECDFETAFEIADLGSPETFLKWLGKISLLNSSFAVSMKCYRKLNLPHMIDYVRTQQLKAPQDCTTPKQTEAIIKTEIAMMENEFLEASYSLKDEGVDPVLVEVFVKMRKFQFVKDLLNEGDERVPYILNREAEWEEQMGHWQEASSLYLKANNYMKAVDIIGETKIEGWVDLISDLSLKIPHCEVDALKKCSFYLSTWHGLDNVIKSILIKIKDYSSLMELYIKNHQWIEAGKLYSANADEIDDSLIILYADWLASQGDWKRAVAMYEQVDRQDKSIDLKVTLIEKEILEENFKEASWLYTSISLEADLMVS